MDRLTSVHLHVPLFIILPLWLVFILVSTCHASETYYVKPTPESACPGHPCEILQYYLDSLGGIPGLINIIDRDITMLFLSGNHTVDRVNISDYINLIRSSITIAGPESGEDAEIYNITQDKCQNMNSCGFFFQLKTAQFYIHHISLRQVYIPTVVMDDQKLDSPSFLHFSSVNMCLCAVYTSVLQTHVENLFQREGFFHSLQNLGDITFTECTFSWQSLVNIFHSVASFSSCTFSESQLVVMDSNVLLSGTNTFVNTSGTAVKCYQSNFIVSGPALFVNNSGTRGAGLALYSSTLYIGPDANLSFTNNLAIDKGGAMYIEPSLSPFVYVTVAFEYLPICFYRLLDCNSTSRASYSYNVHFFNNSAYFGGDDIYGASFTSPHCQHPEEQNQAECRVTVTGSSSNISSVSSDPTRICLCDSSGQPQCGDDHIQRQVSSGENFSLSVVPAGENNGTTSGEVVAFFLNGEPIQTFRPGNRVSINSKHCTNVEYSIYSKYTNVQASMYLSAVYSYPKFTVFFKVDNPAIRSIIVNLTIVPCPPGFHLVGDPISCDCYHNLCDTDVRCTIRNGNGLFSSNGSLWIGNSAENKTVCNQYCDVNYCNLTGEWIDILHNPDSQCVNNRAGRLCGGCRKNYSLAIGTNRCIHCSNNNNVALLIFFVLAGFLLVFFITILNLTVTQNMVNGLIFYANIMWIYQDIFFTKGEETNTSSVIVFLKTFIAWANLDFGIEVCFVKGLTEFWKLWLQFLFPFYIWCIVWLIIVSAKRSTRITRLLPSKRTIPILATVFLLSYMKLVGITNSALKFSFISEYPANYTTETPKRLVSTVWSLDGNLVYCGFPHIILFLAGLATLVILWLPYTLVLFLMQWLRMFSHWRLLRWTQRSFPITDAYFAPLKHKHQYWFGVLLLMRGVLLVISTSSFGIPHSINLLILLVVLVLLLVYMNLMQVYKDTGVLILTSSFFVNLIVLSGYFILTYTRVDWKSSQMTAVAFSTGITFLQLCGIVAYSIISECKLLYKQCRAHALGVDGYEVLGECDGNYNHD